MAIYRDEFDYDTEEDDGIEFLDDNYEEGWYEDDDDEPVHRAVSSTAAASKTKKSANTSNVILSEILSYVKIVLVAIAIAFVFTQFIIVNAQVPSGSMRNTIVEDDRLIGFRLAYTFDAPQRGDIIIFKFPDDEKQNYVKRVIGLPGDVVQIIHGQVFVNGELLDEPYLAEKMNDNEVEETYIVPSDHYFVLGDNRNSSLDSRYWKNTYVARNKILAKVIFRYYSGAEKHLSFKLFN